MKREILDFASVKVNARNDGGNETSVGSGGLAGMGDPCLRLWAASDLSVTPVELNYKRTGRRACPSDAAPSSQGGGNFKCTENRRLCLCDRGCYSFILSYCSVPC